MLKIRKEIMVFAEAMERVMRKHDPVKGDSYKKMSHEQLQNLLINAMKETYEVDAKMEEWVDVANICMMIYWRTCGKRELR